MADAIETPDDLKAKGAELIAFDSTQNDGLRGAIGLRPRWRELAVWFLHDPNAGSRRWVAQEAGRTTVAGESDRVTRLKAGTLDRALKLFGDDSALSRAVAGEAREWETENAAAIDLAYKGLTRFASDAEALKWLYGEPDGAHTGYATMLAKDLDCKASTVRMQMQGERQVMVPLRAILPFIDRAAFRRVRENRRG